MAFSSAVQLDTVHLKEVLREIVLNALEAMPDGGEVRVETQRGDGPEGRPIIMLEVADMGRGTTAEDGEQGWQRVQQFDPQFVILDSRLPGMAGIDLLRKVRQMNLATLVIMTTAYGTVNDAVEAMKLGSVNINAAQNNPWQNDVTYRGFLASPLTGSPIGLSVYLDGMRFNDGFGETMNWDLICQSAIAEIDVIPGSNPVFGLNTLGGALNIRTKRGFDLQGTEVEASGGSFGRWLWRRSTALCAVRLTCI